MALQMRFCALVSRADSDSTSRPVPSALGRSANGCGQRSCGPVEDSLESPAVPWVAPLSAVAALPRELSAVDAVGDDSPDVPPPSSAPPTRGPQPQENPNANPAIARTVLGISVQIKRKRAPASSFAAVSGKGNAVLEFGRFDSLDEVTRVALGGVVSIITPPLHVDLQ